MDLVERISKLRLSGSAISYFYTQGKCYLALDFAGYLMDFPAKYGKIAMAISLNGLFGFFSTDPKKILKESSIKRVLRYLIKHKFLISREIEPFPEFELHNQLPYKEENLIIVKDYFWGNQ